MTDLVEGLVALIMLLVGLMVAAVLIGVDPSLATGIFEELVSLLVFFFLIAVIVSIFISVIGGR